MGKHTALTDRELEVYQITRKQHGQIRKMSKVLLQVTV